MKELDPDELLRLSTNVVELEGEVFHFGFTRILMAVAFVMLTVVGIAFTRPEFIVVGGTSGALGVAVHIFLLESKVLELEEARLQLHRYLGKSGRGSSEAQ